MRRRRCSDARFVQILPANTLNEKRFSVVFLQFQISTVDIRFVNHANTPLPPQSLGDGF